MIGSSSTSFRRVLSLFVLAKPHEIGFVLRAVLAKIQPVLFYDGAAQGGQLLHFCGMAYGKAFPPCARRTLGQRLVPCSEAVGSPRQSGNRDAPRLAGPRQTVRNHSVDAGFLLAAVAAGAAGNFPRNPHPRIHRRTGWAEAAPSPRRGGGTTVPGSTDTLEASFQAYAAFCKGFAFPGGPFVFFRHGVEYIRPAASAPGGHVPKSVPRGGKLFVQRRCVRVGRGVLFVRDRERRSRSGCPAPPAYQARRDSLPRLRTGPRRPGTPARLRTRARPLWVFGEVSCSTRCSNPVGGRV